jgi:predicted site-specific integrase-resolvase
LEIIKLSEYAKLHGVTYRTVWNKFKAGKIPNAYKDEFGNILVKIENLKENLKLSNKVAIYARVSSNENKSNLDSQANRLKEYAIAKGYMITHIVKEVGSGVNDNRKKLLKLLQKNDYGILLVEHKDRLTRFGFSYIETLLEDKGIKVEVINEAEDETSDLIQDLISIIYSFSARMYGLRRSKRKTEEIIKCLQEDNND